MFIINMLLSKEFPNPIIIVEPQTILEQTQVTQESTCGHWWGFGERMMARDGQIMMGERVLMV